MTSASARESPCVWVAAASGWRAICPGRYVASYPGSAAFSQPAANTVQWLLGSGPRLPCSACPSPEGHGPLSVQGLAFHGPGTACPLCLEASSSSWSCGGGASLTHVRCSVLHAGAETVLLHPSCCLHHSFSRAVGAH